MKRIFLSLAVLTMATSCKSLPPADQAACDKTIMSYPTYRDDKASADLYADLFTDDGAFELMGQVSKGRSELIARHQEANTASVYKHEVTGYEVFEQDGQVYAKGTYTVSITPRKPNAETVVRHAEFEDKLVLENGVCKIQYRKVVG
jgi:hypothetical protein